MIPAYKPQLEVVLHNGDKVAVAELDFPTAFAFLRKIGEVGRDHLAAQQGDESALANPRVFFDELPGLLLKFEELSGFLLRESVVRPEGAPDPLLGRGLADFLKVLGAALDINTSPAVCAAVEGLAKNVQTAMKGLRPVMAKGTGPGSPA